MGTSDLSLNQIIQYFAGLAAKSERINSFGYGPVYDISQGPYFGISDNGDVTRNTDINLRPEYPLMWVEPVTNVLRRDSLLLKHKIHIVDLVEKDLSNRLDVMSDTLRSAMEIKAFIWKDFQYDIFPDSESDLEPVFEKYDDEVAGHVMELDLQLDWLADVCNIPGLYPSGATFNAGPGYYSVSLNGYVPLGGNVQMTGPLSGGSIYEDFYYSAGTPLNTILNTYYSGGSSASLWAPSTGTNSIIANNGTTNIAGPFSIAAGSYNSTTNYYSVIGGGYRNNSTAGYSFIGGGFQNTISGQVGVIGGGRGNNATGTYSSVLGGQANWAKGLGSGVAGGRFNSATTTYGFVGGGSSNLASGVRSSVLGGNLNKATAANTIVGGGNQNSATTVYASVLGGLRNLASGAASIVLGGGYNTASGYNSKVGSGLVNTATANFSVVVGGRYNNSTGNYSSILGGKSNTVSGNYSFILGRNIVGAASNTTYVENARLAETTGTIIYSAGTPLEQIFQAGGSINGTTNYIPVFTSNTTLGNSLLTQGASGITLNGSVQIYGNVDILGTASTFNTQTVQTKDNNITLNMSGSHVSALYGGITVLSGTPSNASSTWTIDANGNWSANTGIYTSGLTLTDQPVPAAAASGTFEMFSYNQQGFSTPHIIDTQGNQIEVLRDNITIVRNTTGAAMSKGQAVYVTGSTGTVPTVALSIANDSTKLPSIGVLYENINNNSFGRVMLFGNVENLNLSAFNSGDQLYISPTTPGALTNVKPVYPNYAQSIGTVLNNGNGNGVLEVRPFAVNGILNGDNAVLNSLTATTYYSGSTPLSSIFLSSATTVSAVRGGSNITTGGTFANTTINLVASPSIQGLTTSGDTWMRANLIVTGGTTANTFSNGSQVLGSETVNFTGSTILSGLTVSSLPTNAIPVSSSGKLINSNSLTWSVASNILNVGQTTDTAYLSAGGGVRSNAASRIVVFPPTNQTAGLLEFQDNLGSLDFLVGRGATTSGFQISSNGVAFVSLAIPKSTGNIGIGGIASPSAFAHINSATTSNASLRLAPGYSQVAAPNSGDLWNDQNYLNVGVVGLSVTGGTRFSAVTATSISTTTITASTHVKTTTIQAGSTLQLLNGGSTQNMSVGGLEVTSGSYGAHIPSNGQVYVSDGINTNNSNGLQVLNGGSAQMISANGLFLGASFGTTVTSGQIIQNRNSSEGNFITLRNGGNDRLQINTLTSGAHVQFAAQNGVDLRLGVVVSGNQVDFLRVAGTTNGNTGALSNGTQSFVGNERVNFSGTSVLSAATFGSASTYVVSTSNVRISNNGNSSISLTSIDDTSLSGLFFGHTNSTVHRANLTNFNTGATGNYAGTSIPFASTLWINKNNSAGQNGSGSTVIQSAPFILLPGQEATNYGLRADFSGIKIDQIQNLHNYNDSSVAFAVSGTSQLSAVTLNKSTSTLKLSAQGGKIFIATGTTNATAGQGTLVAGTATINTTSVTNSSMIFVSDAGGGIVANIGSLYSNSVTGGTGFKVTSTNALDSSNFNWFIIDMI